MCTFTGVRICSTCARDSHDDDDDDDDNDNDDDDDDKRRSKARVLYIFLVFLIEMDKYHKSTRYREVGLSRLSVSIRVVCGGWKFCIRGE